MSSTKAYLDFILEQLSDLPDITYRAMMGEYILYYRGKIVGGIYDDRLLVKPTKSALAAMPNAPYELPYEGAKPMLLVEDVDSKDALTALFQAMYPELPAPKAKKKPKNPIAAQKEQNLRFVEVLLFCFLCYRSSSTFFSIHFPLMNRPTYQRSRSNQSTNMAIQTPRTPKPKPRIRIMHSATRNTHMDAAETIMLYFTSPAARIPLGRVNARGQIKGFTSVMSTIIRWTICALSGLSPDSRDTVSTEKKIRIPVPITSSSDIPVSSRLYRFASCGRPAPCIGLPPSPAPGPRPWRAYW